MGDIFLGIGGNFRLIVLDVRGFGDQQSLVNAVRRIELVGRNGLHLLRRMEWLMLRANFTPYIFPNYLSYDLMKSRVFFATLIISSDVLDHFGIVVCSHYDHSLRP